MKTPSNIYRAGTIKRIEGIGAKYSPGGEEK